MNALCSRVLVCNKSPEYQHFEVNVTMTQNSVFLLWDSSSSNVQNAT